jgi:chemotaxis protein MotB
MAGKGGGSWKVAYADFVTAMMAFFLVMWIGAQDVKVKQAVANYFVDPSGASKKPVKNGAVMDKLTGGAVPDAEKTATGRGRNSYSSPNEGSWATKLVGEFIHGDPKTVGYWRDQAASAKQAAASSPEVRSQKATVEEVATKLITKQLRDEIAKQIPASAGGVYQDLLYGSILEVNWTELAEDLVRADKQ